MPKVHTACLCLLLAMRRLHHTACHSDQQQRLRLGQQALRRLSSDRGGQSDSRDLGSNEYVSN
eukprot:8765189-Heterocapsa_arctica.AAC.1